MAMMLAYRFIFLGRVWLEIGRGQNFRRQPPSHNSLVVSVTIFSSSKSMKNSHVTDIQPMQDTKQNSTKSINCLFKIIIFAYCIRVVT